MIAVTHTDRAGRILRKRVRRPKIWKGKRDTKAIVSLVRKSTVDGVAAGVDAKGRPFARYSDEYAKRTGKTRVDLRRTGAMLASLTVEATATGGSVVANTTRAAVHHFGSKSRGIPARGWFGVRSATASEALKEADRRVDANLRGQFAGKAAARALGARTGSTRGVL